MPFYTYFHLTVFNDDNVTQTKVHIVWMVRTPYLQFHPVSTLAHPTVTLQKTDGGLTLRQVKRLISSRVATIVTHT